MSFDSSLIESQELRKAWGWLVALGIGLILAGLAAISSPYMGTQIMVVLLGILLIAAGIAQLVSTFHCSGWRGVMLHLLVSILYLVTGFLVLEKPYKGAMGLTLILAAFFLTTGLIRIVVALKERFPGWGWVLLSGAVTALLGIIIWRQFPDSAEWLIGLLVGVDLVFGGWMWVMLGFMFRQIPKHEAPTSTGTM
ncbi:HdeD family acid-resistance protein [Aeoliella sp. ICT_H6.2]|uniref:HdeD family acid-resistance protein n=1 Tax=Aeoliella straminimaris TaxID=2954799 RepID=A0A9X2FCU9_9BACT|nr:HdeD family acid-resistance protein [Aeoliella straminimaris]MCO6045727.1 HdeD family acid-resistance protein [Aeoliella straminimaris]